jgi:peptidoglycan glycosyltransferase
MAFQREVGRLLTGLFFALGFVVLGATYWAVLGDSILRREDNPRRVEAEAALWRGALYDREDNLLAQTVRRAGGVVGRNYLRPEVYGVIGYASLRYGVGGAEAAFDPVLRGDDLAAEPAQWAARDLLHQPPRGSDVRLTLDLRIQRAALLAMGRHTGAAVVLNEAGEVLALVSLPTYDPNALDARWEALRAAPEQPFFNRALQGRYQPGAVLQTALLAAALIEGHAVDAVVEDAGRALTLENLVLPSSANGAVDPVVTADVVGALAAPSPVVVDTVTLRCAAPPPSNRLTLGEAYAFACPGPFADLLRALGAEAVSEGLDLFALNVRATLPGFIEAIPTAGAAVTPLAPSELDLADIAGQGGLTVSALDMAVMAAAVLNDGNAPSPRLLLATRRPDETAWARATTLTPDRPVMTSQTARRMQALMRAATVSGAARRAARTEIAVGGHVGLAYAGEQTQTWFVGYALTGQNQGVALALVLEDFDDPDAAAALGGQMLEAAHRYSLPEGAAQPASP